MKKTLIYVTLAVLLGVALRFIPWSLFTAEPSNEMGGYSRELSPQLSTNTYKESVVDSEVSAGIKPSYPSDAISVGLMLTLSLIFAVIVSSTWRRKVVSL